MNRKIKVVAFSHKIYSSVWVGVIQPLAELAIRKHIEFTFRKALKITKRDIAELDVLVCIRGFEQIDLEIVKECRRLNKYIIYYMDDDLCTIPDNLSDPLFNSKALCDTIQSIMLHSDCLWTTNRNICRKYGPIFKRSFVANAPALLLNEKQTPPVPDKNDKSIIIGFAGGIHHQKPLEQFLEEPIRTIMQRYGQRVDFEFFGPEPAFVKKFKLHHIPHVNDPEDYRKIMHSRYWDIGLAPLHDSEFHRCKYYNKFLEYGAIGAAGIYSNVEPFSFVVKNVVNGMLVDQGKDNWTKALVNLIENKDVRERIRNNAWELLKRGYSLEAVAEQLWSVFEEIGLHKAPACKSDQVRYKEVYWPNLVYELHQFFKRHGAGAFPRICKKASLDIGSFFNTYQPMKTDRYKFTLHSWKREEKGMPRDD